MTNRHPVQHLSTLLLGVLLGGVTPVSGPALAQSVPPAASGDGAQKDKLIEEIVRLQGEVVRLKKRLAELEQENAALKAGSAGGPGGGKPAGGSGKPGEKNPDFAAVPAEPLGAPEAALQTFQKEYRDKLGELPRSTQLEKDKALQEVGKWVRGERKFRGRVDWIIEVIERTPDALKGGGAIKFRVVDPVGHKAYSDLEVTQALNPALFKAVSDKSDQKLWKLVGSYAAEAQVAKDLETGEKDPMFIGPCARMNTNLSVQTLTPAGGATP